MAGFNGERAVISDVAIIGRNKKCGLTRDAEILNQGLASIGVEALFSACESDRG